MRNYSSNNTYSTSDGERISSVTIQNRIRKAKQKKIDLFIRENGYIFCEDCGKNDCKPVDCSHDISVKQCLESGMSELAYDVNNITLRGRKCHKKHDKS